MQELSLEQIFLDNQPSELDTARCWYFVMRAMESRFFDVYYLKEMLNRLSRYVNYEFDCLSFSFNGEELLVSYLGESAYCAPAALVRQLRLVIDIYESENIYV